MTRQGKQVAERYFRVGPRFWVDSVVRAWDDDAKLAAMYVLTCEHRITEGLFRLPLLYAAHDLGWTTGRVEAALAVLERDGFIRWDRAVDVVLIVNALRWQPPAAPNNIRHAISQLRDLPQTELINDLLALADRHAPQFASDLQDAVLAGLGR